MAISNTPAFVLKTNKWRGDTATVLAENATVSAAIAAVNVAQTSARAWSSTGNGNATSSSA